MTLEQAQKLGKVWEKSGMKRIYINDQIITQAIGLDLSFYKTGNISASTLNGEAISHSRARDILFDIKDSKFWFDLADNQFHIRSTRNWDSFDLENSLCKLADK